MPPMVLYFERSFLLLLKTMGWYRVITVYKYTNHPESFCSVFLLVRVFRSRLRPQYILQNILRASLRTFVFMYCAYAYVNAYLNPLNPSPTRLRLPALLPLTIEIQTPYATGR